MKQRLFALFVLGVAAHADAGGVIELVPDDTGPYLPGQSVSVDVWLHNGDAVRHDLRLVALDVRALRDRLFAGGDFTSSDAATVDHVAKLSAESWMPVGGGMNGPVYGLTSLPGEPPPNLVAGGLYDMADGQSAGNIARWNGYAWSEFGGGIGNPPKGVPPEAAPFPVGISLLWFIPVPVSATANQSFPRSWRARRSRGGNTRFLLNNTIIRC